jgi:hypothetical protein
VVIRSLSATSFRGARSAESIATAGRMDSGPAPRGGASRNDEREIIPLSTGKMGDHAMSEHNELHRPDTPFPRHWLYYIAIKIALLAGATALVLKLYDFW